jgi:hypothetical protein
MCLFIVVHNYNPSGLLSHQVTHKYLIKNVMVANSGTYPPQ